MSPFEPGDIEKAIASARWAGMVRLDLDAASLGSWDSELVRESRVLVPVDVQALVVPEPGGEPMVRLPLAVAAPDGEQPAPATPVLEDGTPREPGVHLHWAPPDALLRGRMTQSSGSEALSFPALPDRWVVLRLAVPKGAAAPSVRGWVVEADTARAVPLESWPAGAGAVAPTGRHVPPAELTAAVGGSLNWVGVYDAAFHRCAIHDGLDDLAAIAPEGLVDGGLGYLVAGWWSDPRLDPLDGAQTSGSLHTRLSELGWALTEDQEGGDRLARGHEVTKQRRQTIGIETRGRYSEAREQIAQRAPAPNLPLLVKEEFKYQPQASIVAEQAFTAAASEPSWPRSVLLHGAVHGVPAGEPAQPDNRPAADEVGIVLGEHSDDLAAAIASAALASGDPAERRALERLLGAFTGGLLDRVGTSDGLVDIEQHEHAEGFLSRPGGAGGVDRLQAGAQLGAAKAGRKGRSDRERLKGDGGEQEATAITSFGRTRGELLRRTKDEQRRAVSSWEGERDEREPEAEAREVVRPAPRLHLAVDPVVGLRGVRRSLRHGGDGRASPDGLLQCRWASQIAQDVDQVVRGADLLPSLGTGALPDEVTPLAREALLTNPYLTDWLAQVTATDRGVDPKVVGTRLQAEALLRFGADAVYDGRTTAFTTADRAGPAGAMSSIEALAATDELRRFSLVAGVDADPVAVTAWSQPWVPLWLEWEVTAEVSDALNGWRLGAVDLEPADGEPPAGTARTVRGRSPLSPGAATTLASAVNAWLEAEEARDRAGTGEADEQTEAALSRIADAVEHLDAVGASLDGLREQLLGFAYDGGLLRPRGEDGALGPAAVTGAEQLLIRAGTLRVERLRLVDAFGRTLELPAAGVRLPVRNAVGDAPPALRLRPRLTVPARLLLRFVDAADSVNEAGVDQLDPGAQVNPVAGFLLPDHIDEALEVFDVAGEPLGQLTHEPLGGGVAWEIAPGREGPPDAGPLHGLSGGAARLGRMAATIVGADARARDGMPAVPERESALSALLRAIDTTLWTVDPFQALGTEHIAGLVGRPIAVVRARLSLEMVPDLGLDAEAVTAALADRPFRVRLGELTRADDGLLAYLVDEDPEHVRVVDRVVLAQAFAARHGQGHLARYGTAPQVPDAEPITHPFLVAEDEVLLHAGRTIMVTLLMHPGARVHATSGILPRKALQLARDWVAPGLAVIAPSVRVGPALVDPAEVRLPKVSAFPKEQLFTRRETPSAWRDDPILAATQTALLPDLPHEVQEGYIRIGPAEDPA
jgi:hypothetical protein